MRPERFFDVCRMMVLWTMEQVLKRGVFVETFQVWLRNEVVMRRGGVGPGVWDGISQQMAVLGECKVSVGT